MTRGEVVVQSSFIGIIVHEQRLLQDERVKIDNAQDIYFLLDIVSNGLAELGQLDLGLSIADIIGAELDLPNRRGDVKVHRLDGVLTFEAVVDVNELADNVIHRGQLWRVRVQHVQGNLRRKEDVLNGHLLAPV